MSFWYRNIIVIWMLMFPGLGWAGTAQICLVERITKSLPTYGATFENGVALAIREFDASPVLQSRSFFYDPDPMAPMKLYPQLKEAGCDAIIGFSYLADLLIFVEARKRDQSNAFSRVPIFTPFATVEPEKKLDLQNVFFFNLPPSHLVQSMFDYLNFNHKISDPIIITEINRLEMQAYRDAYDRIFRKNKWPVTHISIGCGSFWATAF